MSYCTFTGRCDDEGVDAVNAAIDLDRELGLVDHLPVSLVVLGQIYQCHGQPQMAITLYTEALELAVDLDEPQILFPCYDGLATVHLDIDDIDTAERYMDLAQKRLRTRWPRSRILGDAAVSLLTVRAVHV